MSWNATKFCHGMESGLLGALNQATLDLYSPRPDTSGPAAVEALISHLRLERRRSAALRAELADVYARLEAAEERLRHRPRSGRR